MINIEEAISSSGDENILNPYLVKVTTDEYLCTWRNFKSGLRCKLPAEINTFSAAGVEPKFCGLTYLAGKGALLDKIGGFDDTNMRLLKYDAKTKKFFSSRNYPVLANMIDVRVIKVDRIKYIMIFYTIISNKTNCAKGCFSLGFMPFEVNPDKSIQFYDAVPICSDLADITENNWSIMINSGQGYISYSYYPKHVMYKFNEFGKCDPYLIGDFDSLAMLISFYNPSPFCSNCGVEACNNSLYPKDMSDNCKNVYINPENSATCPKCGKGIITRNIDNFIIKPAGVGYVMEDSTILTIAQVSVNFKDYQIFPLKSPLRCITKQVPNDKTGYIFMDFAMILRFELLTGKLMAYSDMICISGKPITNITGIAPSSNDSELIITYSTNSFGCKAMTIQNFQSYVLNPRNPEDVNIIVWNPDKATSPMDIDSKSCYFTPSEREEFPTVTPKPPVAAVADLRAEPSAPIITKPPITTIPKGATLPAITSPSCLDQRIIKYNKVIDWFIAHTIPVCPGKINKQLNYKGIKFDKTFELARGANGIAYLVKIATEQVVIKIALYFTVKDKEELEWTLKASDLVRKGRSQNFLLVHDMSFCADRMLCGIGLNELAGETAKNARGCNMIVMEKAERKTLKNAFEEGWSSEFVINIMCQLYLAILTMQTTLEIAHKDLHWNNVFLIQCPNTDDSHFEYAISYPGGTKTFDIPNIGYIPIIADFGYAKKYNNIWKDDSYNAIDTIRISYIRRWIYDLPKVFGKSAPSEVEIATKFGKDGVLLERFFDRLTSETSPLNPFYKLVKSTIFDKFTTPLKSRKDRTFYIRCV